jgi:hypothetical protein
MKELFDKLTPLTPRELVKPNMITGESRLNILRKEIENNIPLALASGGDFTVTDIKSALNSIEKFRIDNKSFELYGNNISIKSSKLGKSKVFGGGGSGAGGGTALTVIVESAQCVWITAMLDNGIQPQEFFTNQVLKKSYSKVKVDSSLEDILSLDDSWITSSYKSAAHIITSCYVHSDLVCHRGSKEMKAIYAAKTLALKNKGLRNISDDKWNPSDIWLINKSFDINSLPTTSIEALNAELHDQFNKRNIIGISLKKIVDIPKISVYNLDTTNIKKYKLSHYSLSAEKRGTIWTSKGGYLYYDFGWMEWRPNAAFGIHKAEIRGKTARGGGVSWGFIQNYAKLILGETLPSCKDMIKTANNIYNGDIKDVATLWKMLSKLEPYLTREEFDDELYQKDPIWIHAKLGIIYAFYIMEINKSKSNKFITKLINYAGSELEESSVYIKVYE